MVDHVAGETLAVDQDDPLFDPGDIVVGVA